MNAPTLERAREAYQEAAAAFPMGRLALGDATQPGTRLDDRALDAIATLLRSADVLFEAAGEGDEEHLDPEMRALLPSVRALRQLAYLVLATQSPEDAWFWTSEWQAGEREVDAQMARGEGTLYEDGEAFLAALEADIAAMG